MPDKHVQDMMFVDLPREGIGNRSRSGIGSRFTVFLLILSSAWLAAPARGASTQKVQDFVHHEIEAKIAPGKHLVSVVDRITVPSGFPREFSFLLHKGLNPLSETPGAPIRKERTFKHPIAESYHVKLPAGKTTLVVRYQGAINHPVQPVGKEQARGFSQTPGVISTEGVYLAGSSCWYPAVEGTMMTFSLKAEVPPGWDAVSQGKRTLLTKEKAATIVQWESPEPQDEIFIVSAPFVEYTQPAGHVLAMVFLRTPDKGLAEKYLDAAAQYISMYEKLIGPYPYAKFALVENFWETGFGMPSFTLLGPKVIRLPFIISSSYPHEILHNWWGNSVFPDYEKGNWSEGLTAYLSDHLIKEQEGSGAEYRQATLQKYADYVLSGRDFPLAGFRSRHSSSSEAVGYGKSLMFFHMLRQELGDDVFIQGLRDFYRKNRFRSASFDDLRKSFESVSGKHLGKEFHQWVQRQGAPRIRLSRPEASKDENGYSLTAVLEQVQPGEAYLLRIPVAVTMEGKDKALQTVVKMDGRQVELRLHLPSRPLRIDVDPEFDVFRRLDRQEIPPAISQALGAKKMLILLPSSADKRVLQGYRDLSAALGMSGPDKVEVRLDNQMKELPVLSAVAVLGWENRFLKEVMSALSDYDVTIDSKGLRMGKAEIPRENHSVVLTARNPRDREMALMFIASGSSKALPGLGRKLPHYHKYSYLAFEGDEPANVAKGRWPVIDSPMTAFLPGRNGIVKVQMGALARKDPLISLSGVFSKELMMGTITFLSGDELRGRGLGTEGLARAAEFIAEKFREAGLEPGGDREGSYIQTWEETVQTGETKTGSRIVMRNVIGVVPGKKSEYAGESVVVGAHYDHLGLGWPDVREGNKGNIHPGADDNASGVSVLVELARLLAKTEPERSVIFVAFTGEEAQKKGSKHYVAAEKRYPVEKCIGMLNLDTVGRLGGKKLLVLGATSAKEWTHIFRGAGFVSGADIEAVSEELDSSDQTSFREAGVPAAQLFTGPHPDYHRPTDTVDKIDPEGLVKVASVAKEVIEYLSSRNGPLTEKTGGENRPAEKKERKVSLGTIPDFAYSGKGCRLSGIVPGSPAEASGLREEDVIIGINSSEVHNLKDLSEILTSLVPGNRISITFLREGKEMTAEAEVQAK